LLAAFVFWVTVDEALDDRLVRSAFISLSLFAVPHALWRTYDVLRSRLKVK
jgi:hypothetical protein